MVNLQFCFDECKYWQCKALEGIAAKGSNVEDRFPTALNLKRKVLHVYYVSDVLDDVTKYLGIGSYHNWPEEKSQEWLLFELRGKHPLFSHYLPQTDEISDVLQTFHVLSELPSDSLGAYIISMATSPSDVLAVELLQRECRVKNPLRVVPLFEKVADLEAAPAALARLFSINWYVNRINGK